MAKMDKKLVASQQDQQEVYYISKTYRIPVKSVRRAIATANKSGKPCRSRAKIYDKLKEMGWLVITVKNGKRHFSKVAQNDRPY